MKLLMMGLWAVLGWPLILGVSCLAAVVKRGARARAVPWGRCTVRSVGVHWWSSGHILTLTLLAALFDARHFGSFFGGSELGVRGGGGKHVFAFSLFEEGKILLREKLHVGSGAGNALPGLLLKLLTDHPVVS